jgi:hypothetical protein
LVNGTPSLPIMTVGCVSAARNASSGIMWMTTNPPRAR